MRVGLGASLVGSWSALAPTAQGADEPGVLVGEPTASRVAQQVLREGGNAFDALVAGALAGAVAAPHQTGIGGYGAMGLVYSAKENKFFALDANSAAPALMTRDFFQPNSAGKSRPRPQEFGWFAAGVPGVLAGLQTLIDRFGTRPFRDLVQPAIRLCRDGFIWPKNLTAMVRGAPQFRQDPGSRKLYLASGDAPVAGERFRNPELGELLERLAQANSVKPFYDGDIATQIAAGFAKNGGILTAEDLRRYEAHLVEPLRWQTADTMVLTAPLTAGGLSVFQALQILGQLKWPGGRAPADRTHARVEALRWAWRDRLQLLGDPRHVTVPTDRLLSPEYATECAAQIELAVQERRRLDHPSQSRDHGGTIHLSAADTEGNLVALTLTHGNSFGARVTVEGLGLTLGHGMSRFDPDPEHPNSPGPGKRPLNNMVPTIVAENGAPRLAIGGRGGRKIPNALFEFLTQRLWLGRTVDEALAAPRLHTEGGLPLTLEKHWPDEERQALAKLGYRVLTGPSAVLSAAGRQADGTFIRGDR